MGYLTSGEEGLVFFACFAKTKTKIIEAADFFRRRLKCKIILKSDFINFNQTDYYKKEMGTNLKKALFLTDKKIMTDKIPRIKILSNEIEKTIGSSEKRKINLDPGYITYAKICLATTKNFSHRIYVSQGIYSEITLMYHKKEIKAMPWTYPDYKTKEFLEFFVRSKLKLRERGVK